MNTVFLLSVAMGLGQDPGSPITQEFANSGLFLRSVQFGAQQKDLTLNGKRTRRAARGLDAMIQEEVTIRLSTSGVGRVDAKTIPTGGKGASCFAGISRPGQSILMSSNCDGDWKFDGEDPVARYLPPPSEERDPYARLAQFGWVGRGCRIGALPLLGQYLISSNIKYTKAAQDTWRGLAVRRLDGQIYVGSDPPRILQNQTFFLHVSPAYSAIGMRIEHISGMGPNQDPFVEYFYEFPKGEFTANGLPRKISCYEGRTVDKLVLVESVEYSKISREPIDPAVFELAAFNLKDPGRPGDGPSGWWLLVGFLVLLAVLGGASMLFFRAARRRKARQAKG
jgi:hypothetical protein